MAMRFIVAGLITRFIKADFDSDLFSYWLDEEAIKKAERFDGKLALVTNVPGFLPQRSSSAIRHWLILSEASVF